MSGTPAEDTSVVVLPLNAVIRTDGTWEESLPSSGGQYSLGELKDAIGGGYIELVRLHDGRFLVCDDSGHIHGLPFNALATGLYLIGRPRSFDWIAGDALVCESWRID